MEWSILNHIFTFFFLNNFTKMLLKGDPNEAGIFKQAVKGVMETVLPHSG